jgi:hypothetical protein
MANIRSNINLICCDFGLATFSCFFQFHLTVKTLLKQPEQQLSEILVPAVNTDFLAFSMCSTLRQRLPFPFFLNQKLVPHVSVGIAPSDSAEVPSSNSS